MNEMEKLDDILERYFKQIFWSLTGIFFVLYILLVGGDYIWTDEAYSFAMVKHTFSEIWKITAADVHPPLYYWYLKFITAPLQYSLIAAKLASILPYMYIIIFGGIQLKDIFNRRTAILFMGLFFCFPFLLSYSIEIRMYSLAAAFVFSCAINAYKMWKSNGEKKTMVGLILSGVGAAYTHYFAFVAICIIYGLLFIFILTIRKQLLKKWLLSIVASVILYLPWLSAFVNQLLYKVSNDYWIPDITIYTLFSYWGRLFGADGISLYALFFSASYLVCLIWILKRKNKNEIMLCLCCLSVSVGTLAVGVVVSIIVRPVFVIRYLIPTIPVLVAFMAIVLGKIKSELLLEGILIIALMGGISEYGVSLYYEYRTHNYLPLENYGDVDAYIADNSHVAGTLGYYVTEKNIYCGDDVSVGNPYPNWFSINDFETDDVNTVIMLLELGETPSSEYYDAYEVEYLGEWKCEYDTDAFLLTKKEK